jgi:hypothetical protein
MPRKQPSVRPRTVLIPETFDLAALPHSLVRYKDQVAYVLSRIRDGKVHHLMAERLDYLFCKQWTNAKRWLITRGIMAEAIKYRVASHSYGYRLTRPYRRTDAHPVPSRSYDITNRILLRKLDQWDEDFRADNYTEAADVFDAIQQNLRLLILDGQPIPDKVTVRTWGRVFTHLTSLPAKDRHLLQVRGQTLACVDVKNCFPVLLGLLCRLEKPQLTQSAKHILQNRNYVPEEVFILKETSSTSTSRGQGCVCTGIQVPGFVPALQALAEQGSFYETLMKAREIPMTERATFKTEFQAGVLAGDYPCEARAAFQGLFPQEYQKLRSVKEGVSKRLIRVLQRLEASIVINVAARDLVAAETWFSPIHDGIVCLPEDVPSVEEALSRAFALYGLHPRFSVKSFGRETAQEAVGRVPGQRTG